MNSVILHFIQPTKNKYRFYFLDIQPDLFGNHCLIRKWGRIGGRGKTLMMPYSNIDTANSELLKYRKKKERKGYKSVINY